MLSMYNWLNERYQIDGLVAFFKKKDVPIHRWSIWYYFGGLTMFLFGVQVITGILLLLYYKPGVDTAFESVQFIITKVQYGWLIRSIHSWGANLMVLSAFIHLFFQLHHPTLPQTPRIDLGNWCGDVGSGVGIWIFRVLTTLESIGILRYKGRDRNRRGNAGGWANNPDTSPWR